MFVDPSVGMNIPAGRLHLPPRPLCLRHTSGLLTAHTHTHPGVPRKSWSHPTSEINDRDTTSIRLQRWTDDAFKTLLRSREV